MGRKIDILIQGDKINKTIKQLIKSAGEGDGLMILPVTL